MNPDPPVSALTAHLGFWLRFVSNHVSRAFAAKLEAEKVIVAEWVVLRSLYHREPQAPSSVAAEIGMTRGAITKLAERLIDKRLVIRAFSPTDGRAQTLALTPRGAQLVPRLAALADRNDAELFDCLSATERRTLERILRRLVAQHAMARVPTE